MPMAATSCLMVAFSIPSIMFRTFRSPGWISSRLRAAYLSPSFFRTNLTFPRTNLPRRSSPDSLMEYHSSRSKPFTLL